ncbi:YbaK/EbsC family protein [Nitratireductor aquimarinus]|uniref:YbaK/EbsC family protein n=1 Tax=Nitratireductor aquimarinus TaxID=889300 RepID=A0ABU4AKL4_9HYPH|nr:YbaK/EbsC family protein [Nitratireductor aquimarinus]MDV6226801.1 YbaK/EbsC family protein [Nitratireductor aquimarinus]
MSKSIRRVQAAAEAAGLEIEIKRMGESTRTAEEAAAQCGCSVAQIVKSLIFRGEESGKLYLFLVSGSRQLALDKASALVGEALKRADPRHIREVTGFAIGGVSPLGQPDDVLRFGDESLLGYDVVWAAAGAHDAVFSAMPGALFDAASVKRADIA